MIFTDNRKAHFNYEILEKYEAGIELFGYEVKAVKAGKVSIVGSHGIVRGGEMYIVGMQIQPYQTNNTPENYDIERTRKLLLNKKELHELADADQKKGLTIVPLSLYSKGQRIKVELAIVKGKKLHDKRETIKKRDVDREIRRSLKE